MELGLNEDISDVTHSTELLELRRVAASTFAVGRARDVEPHNLGLEDVGAFLQQPLDRLERDASPYEDELSFRSRVRNQNQRVVANDILAGVRNDTFLYLMRCESTLRLSVTGAAVYDRHRQRVDRLLESVAPDVLDMLTAAINRAGVNDNPEARVHALTSCRRVLVAIADVVFPPKSAPYVDRTGVEREVGPGQYRNRIVAAIETANPTTHGRALAAGLNEFAARLERLDELTQKGVHDHPTGEDVDFGVIQTYLLAGEVLGACLDHPSSDDDGVEGLNRRRLDEISD